MPFDHGSATFTMFDVSGEFPENIVDLFAARKAGAFDAVTGEPEVGWVTWHHYFDTDINGESCDFGGSWSFVLRQAVRKIPAALLNSFCRREEQIRLRADKKEYLSRKEKREIREEMLDKFTMKMPPTLSGIPVVIEPRSKTLYVGASSQAQIDLFVEQFHSVTGLEPVPFTPALLLERLGFGTAAALPTFRIGEENVPAGDFDVGRDFLMYLWFYGETVGKLTVPDCGDFDLMIEDPLVFAGEGDERGSGEAVIKKGGSPLRSAETKAAVLVGKKLKKAKLSFTCENRIWSCTFDADKFLFGSVRLPEGEAINDYERFAERVENLGAFRSAVTAYFKLFAEAMSDANFVATEKAVREWARGREAI